MLPLFLMGLVAVTVVQAEARRSGFRSAYSSIDSVSLTQSALALQREQDDLKRQLAELRSQLDAIQEQASRTNSDAFELHRLIDGLRADAGLSETSGEGIVVTLDDARLPPSRDSRLVAQAIVHSQDITDVFNSAWKAGATAISVNGERIAGTSACVGATIQINGTLMSPPFVISIVGPVDKLSRILGDPLELENLRARARAFGLRFEMTTSADLRVPAYTGSLNIRYARPFN